jgi:hypothetical protein
MRAFNSLLQWKEAVIQIIVPPGTTPSSAEEREFKRKMDIAMSGPCLQTFFDVQVASKTKPSTPRSLASVY